MKSKSVIRRLAVQAPGELAEEIIYLRDRLAESEKSSELHNKAKNIMVDAYNELKEKFTDAEKRSTAVEAVLRYIKAEISIRVDHGADSNGHLEGLQGLITKWSESQNG